MEGLESHQIEREKLCESRMKEASKCISPDWEINHVKFVIKNEKEKI